MTGAPSADHGNRSSVITDPAPTFRDPNPIGTQLARILGASLLAFCVAFAGGCGWALARSVMPHVGDVAIVAVPPSTLQGISQ